MKSTGWILALMMIMLGFVVTDAAAQRGAVGGEIVDEDGNPMEGVEVIFELADGGGRRTTTKTDKSGRFIKPGLRVGAYRVEIHYEGYQPFVVQANVSTGSQSMLDKVTMYKLPPGVLSETQHAKATELLKAADAGSESGDPATTIESLKKFLELVPDSAEAHFNIAQNYLTVEDKDNALIWFQKTVDLKPDFIDAWVAMGYIYTDKKDWTHGMESFGKACELNPNDVVSAFNYAVHAMNAGESEEAETALKKVVELDPTRAIAHYHLGTVALGRGENEAAVSYFEKYLEVDPEGAYADSAKQVLATLKPQ